MRILELIWDEDAAEHVARHGVEPEEAEEACQRRPYVFRTRHGRYLVLGQTDAGRYVTVIVAPVRGGRANLITARPMTEAERRRYLQQ